MVDQVRTAVSTAASGTFDITVSGQTETPVAALFYVTYATTDDTIASDAVFGWGATDGTGEFCQTVKAEDAQTASDTDRIQSTTACLGIHDPGGSWDGRFSYNSFITGGIRLDIDDQAPSGFLVTAIFFYSADVSDVAIITPGLGSTTSPVNNTSVGFELDVMFTGHIYTTSMSNNSHAPLGLGVVYNDVSATPAQKSMAMCGDSGTSAGGDQNTFIDNSSGLCATLLGSKRWEVTISDIDSTGFTHTSTASTSTVMYCLCLKLETGVSFDLFDLNFPTSGNYAETTPGFEPDFGSIFSMVGPTGYNTFSSGTANVGWSVATFDGTNIYTNNFTDSDGDDPTICKSLSSDQLRILDSDGSTDAVVASSYAFDADGWDFTLSTNPAAAVYGFGWAFKAAGGGGATDITATLESITLTENAATTALDIDITSALESVLLSEQQAGVSLDRTISAVVESVSLTEYQGQVSLDRDITATQQAIQVTENAASVSTDITISGSLESIQVTENAADIAVDVSISGSQEQITITENQASLGLGINATTEQITLSEFVASVSLDRAITGSLETIQIVENAANVAVGLNASVESIVLTENQSTIALDTAVSASLETIVLNELSAQVGLGQNIDANLESITLTENSATLVLDTGVSAVLESISLSTLTATITSSTQAPTVPGLEYTMSGEQLHYTLPVNRLHFTFKSED